MSISLEDLASEVILCSSVSLGKTPLNIPSPQVDQLEFVKRTLSPEGQDSGPRSHHLGWGMGGWSGHHVY